MQDQFLYFVHGRQKLKWAEESGGLGHVLVAGEKNGLTPSVAVLLNAHLKHS